MPKAIKTSTDEKKRKNAIKEKGKSTSKGVKTGTKGDTKLYSNFLPITLEIPTLSPSSSTSTLDRYTSHTIYIRPHSSKSDDIEGGRTLFVVNLPVDIYERDLRVIFGKWGVVESIEFTGGNGVDILEQAVLETMDDELSDDEVSNEEEEEEDQGEGERTIGQGASFSGNLKSNLPRKQRQRKKPTLPPTVPEIIPLPTLNPRQVQFAPSGLRGAHVTYLDAQPVKNAMSHSISIKLDKYNSTSVSGLEYYTKLHESLRPSLGSIKQFSDSSMERFDHLSSLLLSSRAKKQGAGALVDEDGFTVVVRGGRYGRTGGRGRGVASVGVASRGFKPDQKVRGKGAGELPDFYRFQQVDRKRKEFADLRNKFEQDKIKVEEMKRSKRFKPY